MKHGSVDLAAIAKDVGTCKHFCPSKWAKVGGMLQVPFICHHTPPCFLSDTEQPIYPGLLKRHQRRSVAAR